MLRTPKRAGLDPEELAKCKADVVEVFRSRNHQYDVAQGGESRVLAVFVHGWPDSLSMFDEWVAPLNAAGVDCLRLTLPGYEDDVVAARRSVRLLPPLENCPQLFDLIRDAIHDFALEQANGKEICLVGHDWGSMFVFLLDDKYPDFAARIVTLDVGPDALGRGSLEITSNCCPKFGTTPLICFPSSCMFGVINCGYQNLMACSYECPVCSPVCSCFITAFLKTFGAPEQSLQGFHRIKNYLYYSMRGSMCSRARLFCCFCCPCYLYDTMKGNDYQYNGFPLDGAAFRDKLQPGRLLFVYSAKPVMACDIPLSAFGFNPPFASKAFLEKIGKDSAVDIGPATHWLRSPRKCCVTAQAGDPPFLHLPSLEQSQKEKIIGFVVGSVQLDAPASLDMSRN